MHRRYFLVISSHYVIFLNEYGCFRTDKKLISIIIYLKEFNSLDWLRTVNEIIVSVR